MPYINGNLKVIIAIGGFVLSVIGSAVGYGKLNEKVTNNASNIVEVRDELRRVAQDPDASATGAQLRGEIKVLNTQLADMKQQLNRIEAKLDKQR